MIRGKEPLFSVVMPVFNGAEHISETIASLQAQTVDDFELLVMDDGSTDTTADIVSRLAETDPRIKLHQLENGGAANARNEGMRRACGTYLAVNDADDLWPVDRLANQYAVLQKDDTRIVIGGVQRFSLNDAGEKQWGFTTQLAANNLSGRDYVNYLLTLPANHMAIFHTLCGKKTIIEAHGGWDDTLASAEDWDHWLRLAMHVPFCHLDKVLLHYRKYPNSTTWLAAKTRPLDSQLYIVNKIAQRLPLNGWQKRRYASLRFAEAIQNFNYQGDYGLAFKTLLRAAFQSDLVLQKNFYALAWGLFKGLTFSLLGNRDTL